MRISVTLTLSLALLTAGLSPAALAAPPALSAARLRCEYRENPLGLDEPQPRLSWQLQGTGHNRAQTAYRLLAATSRELLREGRADLWDTGKVDSSQNTHVVYRGERLKAGQRAYWRVRAWDESGRPGAYSEAAWFEMGLPAPSDWAGSKWIGLPVERQEQRLSLEGARWYWYPEGNPRQSAPGGARYFRGAFNLPPDRKPTRATFLLAVDNTFTLWVNGKEAGSGGGWQGAAQVDVLPHLKTGPNILAVKAENADAQGGPAGLLGRLYVFFESGEPMVVDLGPRWRVSQTAPAGWLNSGFNDAAWPAPLEIARIGDSPWGMTSVADTDPMPSPHLRREFSVPKPVSRARAYVTALGLFQLHLNGKKVSDDILAPGWTDYRKRVQYRTYDVTRLVRRGVNSAEAILGDGWYAGSLGPGLQRNHFGPNPPRLRLVLRVDHPDGAQTTLSSDESWKGAFGPILASDLYGGETYDARMDGRSSPTRPVTVYTDQNPQVDAQMDPPIRVTEELKTIQVTEPRPGTFVFDLGQNMVGWARLKVRNAKAGDRITLRFAEVLNPDGTVYRDNLRMAKATDVYIAAGRPTEEWEPHFTYHGFRYVEVTGYPGRPSPDAITGRVFHSDMEPTSRFETSSTLVNRLYRNVWWGQRGNLMSVPTDCPQRDERLGWMGDAQLFARASCWYMDMAPFYTKWMGDIVDAQSEAGAFSDVSPRAVDLADGAPAWADAGLVVPWTMYQVYGDKRLLARNYQSMRKYVDLIHSANPNLLWLQRRNNDFGDWVAAGENTNKDLIASAYFAYDLRLLSRMADALGNEPDARKYGDLAARAQIAFNNRFLGPDGRYTGDTQTAYAMALAFDLVTPGRGGEVASRLVEAIARRGFKLGTGFIGTALLLPALSETGHTDVAYRLLTTRGYPSWGYMIDKGATTIWELWNSDTEGPGMNSRNHFAFGAVAEWLQRYLAGIDVNSGDPGYRKIVIRPHIAGSLAYASAEYDSIQGVIKSGWTRSGDGYTLRVTIPPNTTAHVMLPYDTSGVSFRSLVKGEGPDWSDRIMQFPPDAKRLQAPGDRAIYEIGSGDHTFSVMPRRP